MTFPLTTLAAFLLLAPPAFEWNALGHKVVCKIAWDTLDTDTREKIVDTLRRHPRYDQDFAKDLPATDNAELIFWHVGSLPDIARNIQGRIVSMDGEQVTIYRLRRPGHAPLGSRDLPRG